MLRSRSSTPQKVTVKNFSFFAEFRRSDEERGGAIKLKAGIQFISQHICQCSNKFIGFATLRIVY